jgi:hypothetical protein
MKTNAILWVIYGALLAVLMPHTAWAFQQFEPPGVWGTVTAWAGALAFEAAIAALTHKLARHIEALPNFKDGRKRFSKRYLNAYSLGLIFAVGVSTLANVAHAVQFGIEIEIFAAWGVPFAVYAVAFGGILPLASLVFARVLSNVNETEHEADPAVTKANDTIRELRASVREADKRANDAEARFSAIGDMARRLFSDDMRERIITTKQLWPALPQSHVATVAESSPAYVSEVLNGVSK